MPSFMMGPPSPPYRRNTMMIYRMPMPTYHIMFPPPQQQNRNVLPQKFVSLGELWKLQPTPEAIAELPSSENNTPRDDKKVPRRLDRQFPVQMESQRQPMIPQQEVAEQLDESHEAETPELPMVRPHDASADQIFAAMQADPKVDRDAIFRRLLAQSQVENSRQEQQEEATESNDQSNPEIHNEIWKMQQTAQDMDQQQETNGDDALQKQERTSDEIFRIFQQQSLQLQREADARESAESTQLKQEVEQITTETSSTEMPKIMIADSFPRRSTVAEPEEQPSSTSIPFKESTSNESVSSTPRPDPLAAFFRFFENEALKLNSEIRPAIQDIAALSLQATTQTPEGAIDLDEVSGMELDQPEPAEGTSPVGVETPAPQSTATQDTPLIPSTDESIMLEANDEQALLNSWSKDQDPVLEMPERPIVRVVQ
ncbi:hypothetical protein Tcan_04613 [Toxocara canis]|uniref:Uncharacterized protein n=1 Tax=Toxocara canis TaxID=6265 RepID=A0A0B2VWD0_TOXCA|nr:hypothetical protein Tcan_04613 [Toxocara canis]